jgi:hypothetical protein
VGGRDLLILPRNVREGRIFEMNFEDQRKSISWEGRVFQRR